MGWSQEDAVKALLLACKRLGWTVMVPNVDDDSDVEGLVVGTKLFCSDYAGSDWETWETDGPDAADH